MTARIGGKAAAFGRTSALNNASEIVSQSRETATPTQLIPLDRIDMDPENVRPILLDANDPASISDDDPLAARKRDQLEAIQGLAVTISSKGLINPIEVYRRADRYVLVTGQRRFIAHRLLGKEMIRASVLLQRPTGIRAQQFIENEQRKDMTLAERVNGLRPVFAEAGMEEARFADRHTYLQETLGMSKTTSYRYLSILHGPEDVYDAVQNGSIESVKVATKLCNIHDDEERARTLAAYLAGESIETSAPVETPAAAPETPAPVDTAPVTAIKRSAGRPMQTIKLGTVKNPNVVRGIIRDLFGEERLPAIDWTDPKAVTTAFADLLKELEKRYT